MSLEDLANAPRCQHIHYNGKPCKAPARRNRNYCMFHQSAHSGAGHLALPIIEDTHSLQLAIIRILHSVAEDGIDARKASTLLYGLQLAGMNMKRFCEERRVIENPEADIATRAYAAFLSNKMKLPVPSEEEADKFLKEVKYDMPVNPSDRRPTIFPEPDPPDAESDSASNPPAAEAVS